MSKYTSEFTGAEIDERLGAVTNKVDEAPSDGNYYLRKDGDWVETSSGGDGSVDVVQTTGTSTTAVMSQAFVSKYLGHTRKVFAENAAYKTVNSNGQGFTLSEANNVVIAIYLSERLENPYLERIYSNEIRIYDDSGTQYQIGISDYVDSDISTITEVFNDLTITVVFDLSKMVNAGFYGATYEQLPLSDDVYIPLDAYNGGEIANLKCLSECVSSALELQHSSTQTNVLLNSSGATSAVSGGTIYKYDVVEGQKLYVDATFSYNVATGNTRPAYAIYDSSTISEESLIELGEVSSIPRFKGVITIPTGGVMLCLCSYISSTNNAVAPIVVNSDNLYEMIDSNVDSIANNAEKINWLAGIHSISPIGSTSNSLLTTEGLIASYSTTYKIYYIDVEELDTVYLINEITGTANSEKCAYSFVSTKASPTTDTVLDISEASKSLAFEGSISVPENAVRMYFNGLSATPPTVYASSIVGDDVKDSGLNITKSSFGVLANGQGILEDEARAAFVNVYSPIDLYTYYINYQSDGSLHSISFKDNDGNVYTATNIDWESSEIRLTPIVAATGSLVNKDIVAYALIKPSEFNKSTYGTYYAYFNGDEIKYQNLIRTLIQRKEVIAWGDSLTALGSGYGNYLAIPSYVSSVFGVGGETSLQIGGRIGSIPYLVNSDFTIPEDDTSVEVSLKTAWSNSPISLSGTYGLNPCTINGIEGNLITSGFIRSESGDSVEIKAGTPIIPYYFKELNKCVHVFFFGQNGGWDSDPDTLVNQFKTAVRCVGTDKFIVVTPHINTSDELELLMQQTFGAHYFNLREWCVNYGLSESGIDATSADEEAIAAGSCPPSLLGDSVHFVEAARIAQAAKIRQIVECVIDVV